MNQRRSDQNEHDRDLHPETPSDHTPFGETVVKVSGKRREEHIGRDQKKRNRTHIVKSRIRRKDDVDQSDEEQLRGIVVEGNLGLSNQEFDKRGIEKFHQLGCGV